MNIQRSTSNPIVVPGGAPWRNVSTFNPGVILHDGKFYMYERAAGSLQPFQTVIGALVSDDGVHFTPASDEPVLTGDMLGIPTASIEDARVVVLDGLFYICYAMQPYQFDCWPNGIGVPRYYPEHYPEWAATNTEPMITRSGIAVSEDGIHFRPLSYTTPAEIDDRDNALFPEKINGRYALLRRPMQYVGPKHGTERPGIWLSYSDDLIAWTDPVLVAVAENEAGKERKSGRRLLRSRQTRAGSCSITVWMRTPFTASERSCWT